MTQPDVLYFVEHVAREFDIACIIRHLLAARHGIDTTVASIHFDLHAAIAKNRPKVVVTPFFNFANDANIQHMLRGVRGARYVNLAFEQLLSRGNLALKRPRDTVVRRHVRHLASGRWFRDFLCGHGVTPANVQTVGSLPLALYRTPYRQHAEGRRQVLARQFGLDAAKPWVFFPENYSAAFMADRDIEVRIRQGFDRNDAYDYREFARRSFAAVMPWCWQAAGQGRVELILRPRPATARDAWLRACSEVAGNPPRHNLHVIKDGTVREWNLASDIVISSYSSTVVEAAVAGKAAYLLVPEAFPTYMHCEWFEHALRLESADALLAIVRDPDRAQPATELARWANTHLAGAGDPIAATAGAIADACRGGGPSPPPAPQQSLPAALFRRARGRVRARTSGRCRADSRYEKDRFDAEAITTTTAAWACLLGDKAAPTGGAATPPQRRTAGPSQPRSRPARLRPPVPPPVPPAPALAGPAPRSPLKVAFVVSARFWGGGESQVALLADGLRQRGHQCRFFARYGSLCAERLRQQGFTVDTFFGTGRDPVSIWRIHCRLARWQPDVLHLNDSHAITCGGLAAWGLDIPARVVSRRSVFPIRSPRRYGQNVDRVICVARAVADICRRAGMPNDRLRVVHDGTRVVSCPASVRQQVRDELRIGNGQPVLLTVAWLYASKGHRYLLLALPEIVARYPKVTLLLAGSGTERNALQRQAEQLGIDRHVRFLGFRADVSRLIQAADLFVMPTLSEGLCSSLIDAMLGGCPIVTTTVGGIAELVRTDTLGAAPLAWTVPERDPPALAAAILEALGDRQERATRATRAKQRALVRFTADRMVEGTLRVYDELLEPPAPSAAFLAAPFGPCLRLGRRLAGLLSG